MSITSHYLCYGYLLRGLEVGPLKKKGNAEHRRYSRYPRVGRIIGRKRDEYGVNSCRGYFHESILKKIPPHQLGNETWMHILATTVGATSIEEEQIASTSIQKDRVSPIVRKKTKESRGQPRLSDSRGYRILAKTTKMAVRYTDHGSNHFFTRREFIYHIP